MADVERKVGKRKRTQKDYDEDAMVKRYNEVHSTNIVADEFNVSAWTVSKALKRNGVKPCGKPGRRNNA